METKYVDMCLYCRWGWLPGEWQTFLRELSVSLHLDSPLLAPHFCFRGLRKVCKGSHAKVSLSSLSQPHCPLHGIYWDKQPKSLTLWSLGTIKKQTTTTAKNHLLAVPKVVVGLYSCPILSWASSVPRCVCQPSFVFHASDFCDPEKICSLWLDDSSSDKVLCGASGGSPVLPFPRCPQAQQETSGVPLDGWRGLMPWSP